MSGIADAKTPGQALAIALRLGKERLGRSETPMTDARRLLAHAMGVDTGRLPLLDVEDFNDEAMARYVEALDRRGNGEPVSHILGSRRFFNHEFKVGPQVLDPRPETESLVRLALERDFTRVLDLGTGSGAILISLLAERSGARGIGSDLSAAALDLARQNAGIIGVADRCRLMQSDWFAAIDGKFDLIVSNPPYIAADEMAGLAPELAHEPRMALTDEGDGLSAYRAITAGAPQHLEPGGRLLVEIGPTQGAAVAAMFRAAGLENVSVRPDLDGRDRAVQGEMPARRDVNVT